MEIAKDLKTHLLQHDGKKTHSCDQCDYSSTIASNLKSHMLVHIAMPFVCEQCRKQCRYSCTAAGNFKKHMLTV